MSNDSVYEKAKAYYYNGRIRINRLRLVMLISKAELIAQVSQFQQAIYPCHALSL
ncbi:hypothetical protein H6F98_25845 [Microcoleus sp. FACHB-SPT15]|uniref:hypothetical protein n=1 Tax=Microcoleus sp. FACHB-SPT15 TaxID=2692830 RepID=UPI0017850864|nr:hypothetical protein [Microcoleus sp. FACHB-SPT15]MBD1808851.1 hypothetical protein [Microcoleus sp. FACHB-SPT15]